MPLHSLDNGETLVTVGQSIPCGKFMAAHTIRIATNGPLKTSNDVIGTIDLEWSHRFIRSAIRHASPLFATKKELRIEAAI